MSISPPSATPVGPVVPSAKATVVEPASAKLLSGGLPSNGIMPAAAANGLKINLVFPVSSASASAVHGALSGTQVPGPQTVSPTKPSADEINAFLATEKAVRQVFLAAHPYELPHGFLDQYRDRASQEGLFDLDFDGVLVGRTQPGVPTSASSLPKAEAVSLLKKTLGAIFQQIQVPDAGAAGQAASGKVLAGVTRTNGIVIDEGGVDRVAKENLPRFQALIEHYNGPDAARQFVETTLIRSQVQLFLQSFQSYVLDGELPVPFSVYLLDVDDVDVSHHFAAESTQGELGVLFDKPMTDFSDINTKSRLERSRLLQAGLVAVSARAVAAANEGTPESASAFLNSVGMRLYRGPADWTWKDREGLENSTGRDAILRYFGKEARSRFDNLPPDSADRHERQDALCGAAIMAAFMRTAGNFLIQ